MVAQSLHTTTIQITPEEAFLSLLHEIDQITKNELSILIRKYMKAIELVAEIRSMNYVLRKLLNKKQLEKVANYLEYDEEEELQDLSVNVREIAKELKHLNEKHRELWVYIHDIAYDIKQALLKQLRKLMKHNKHAEVLFNELKYYSLEDFIDFVLSIYEDTHFIA